MDNRKRYYMNLLVTANTQKDLIMCNQYGIVEDEMNALIGQKKALMKQEQHNQISFMVILSIMSVLIGGYVGMITIGNVVTYAASITKITKAIYDLVNQIGWMKTETPYAVDFYEYMKLEKRKHEGCIPIEKRTDNKFSVEFEHVSFKYPGSEQYVIKDLNLSFVIGEKMAIIGKNGSGKTTFIKLLARLYDVTEGCIKVNGIDIRKYDYNEYCNLFSVVFQDFAVFDFPLGEVLACENKVDENQAMDALNRAGLGERVSRLSDGLKTYVGKGFNENGVSFSGGELQKIAIARAIYKDAPFVIMDEPTAALDPEAEAEVFEGFDKMVGKKTAIYISHRLASCKFCENILVFDQGQVVQHGTHEELEREEGLYRELWNAQAQYYA
jgi:ATP-binding cassette subfamily B protein